MAHQCPTPCGQQVHGGVGDGGCDDPPGWPGESALQGHMPPAGVHPTPNRSPAMMIMAAAAAAAAAAVAGGFGPGPAVPHAHGVWAPNAPQFPHIPLPQQQQHPRPPPPLPPAYAALASQGSQQLLAHTAWPPPPAWHR
jgi:hypothetical protein